MNNALLILSTLERHLTTPMELTLYGRAAIVLGYPGSSLEQQASLDVDLVVSVREAALLGENESFWDAQEKTNKELESQGLYLTHVFCEDQVILLPDWHQNRMKISLSLAHLAVYRLNTINLILSKMMRDDPQDMADIQFLLRQDPSLIPHLKPAFARAISPDITDIDEVFAKLQPRVLSLAEKVNPKS